MKYEVLLAATHPLFRRRCAKDRPIVSQQFHFPRKFILQHARARITTINPLNEQVSHALAEVALVPTEGALFNFKF